MKVRLTCPAFLAARITSATKLVDRLAPRSPPRMGPGMEVVVPSVHGLKPETEAVDGGRRVEFFAEDASTAIRPLGADGRKPQSSQPHAPTFPAGLFPCRPVVGFRCRLPPLRQPDPAPAMTRNRSLSIMAAMPTSRGRQKGLPTIAPAPSNPPSRVHSMNGRTPPRTQADGQPADVPVARGTAGLRLRIG